MINEKLFINESRNSYMKTYIWDTDCDLKNKTKRPVVVVCPGGGYSFLSYKEGEPIALSYYTKGFNAVVLYYGVGEEHAIFPGPLKDIAACVKTLRENSDKWNINPDEIFVSGFSAGAHVAASLGVFWNNKEVLPEFSDNFSLIRPNGMILGYPVLDLRSTTTRLDLGVPKGATTDDVLFDQRHSKMPVEKMIVFNEKEERYFVNFRNAMNAYIFGGEFDANQESFLCLQNQVTEDTPPAFIWHTSCDGLIKPSNSFLFAEALMDNDVPYELHIFEHGGHGLALANYVTANYPFEIVNENSEWFNLAVNWILSRTNFADRL